MASLNVSFGFWCRREAANFSRVGHEMEVRGDEGRKAFTPRPVSAQVKTEAISCETLK